MTAKTKLEKRLSAIESRLPGPAPETMDPATAATLLAAGSDAADAVLSRTGDPRLARLAARRWLLAIYADMKAGVSTPRPRLSTFDERFAPDAPREHDQGGAEALDQLIRECGGDPSQPPKPLPLGAVWARRYSPR